MLAETSNHMGREGGEGEGREGECLAGVLLEGRACEGECLVGVVAFEGRVIEAGGGEDLRWVCFETEGRGEVSVVRSMGGEGGCVGCGWLGLFVVAARAVCAGGGVCSLSWVGLVVFAGGGLASLHWLGLLCAGDRAVVADFVSVLGLACVGEGVCFGVVGREAGRGCLDGVAACGSGGVCAAGELISCDAACGAAAGSTGACDGGLIGVGACACGAEGAGLTAACC